MMYQYVKERVMRNWEDRKKAEDAYRHPHTLKIFLQEASWQSRLQ